MRRFKWIEWNLQKIAAHGSFEMFAELPSGRRIWVIWRHDREDDEIPDVFGQVEESVIFVCYHRLLNFHRD